MKEQLIVINTDLKSKSAEELMMIYKQHSSAEAYDAFSELYFRSSENAFNYLLKKVKNRADAEDLLQKVFIKIHESRHLYKEKYKFEQWLFVIARSISLDHFRSKTRYQKRLDKIEDTSDHKEHSSGTALLSSLTPDQKELLEMKFIDELSYQEISNVLNKSETSLRKMVSRMLMNLKKDIL